MDAKLETMQEMNLDIPSLNPSKSRRVKSVRYLIRHDDNGTTEWHTVYARSPTAAVTKYLRETTSYDQLTIGDMVNGAVITRVKRAPVVHTYQMVHGAKTWILEVILLLVEKETLLVEKR